MSIDSIYVDCARLKELDASAIDRIARLHLAARRLGLDLRLVNASPALFELADFCGLTAVLRVEVERQPEEREQPRRVEEEGDVTDPAL
jgi:anti-anti-sigma regulatory factor